MIFRIINFILNRLSVKQKSAIYSKLFSAWNSQKYLSYRSKYQLDDSFHFNGNFINFYGEGEIIAGANSYIGNYSSIGVIKGRKVVIGKNCHISHNVRIYTNSNIADQPFNNASKKTVSGDVIIGDYSWIGANVFIVQGITIGKNAVIGANSVVTKDIPDNCIAAGVPARIIKEKTVKI